MGANLKTGPEPPECASTNRLAPPLYCHPFPAPFLYHIYPHAIILLHTFVQWFNNLNGLVIMTAREANEQSQREHPQLKSILSKIESAVEGGDFKIWVWEYLDHDVESRLKDMGYVISRNEYEVGDAKCVVKWDNESLGL